MKDHGRRGVPGDIDEVPRDQAVRELAAYLRDQDARLILSGPVHLKRLGHSLSHMDERWPWVCYIDAGFAMVQRSRRGPQVLAVATLPDPVIEHVSVVLVVPKTVPVTVLNEAMGPHDRFPDNDEQDIFPLADPRSPNLAWPHLFLDAMELVSPNSTREIRDGMVES
jgi:hypothetical protein